MNWWNQNLSVPKQSATLPTTTLFPQEKKHSPCSTLRFPSQLRTIFSTTLPRKKYQLRKEVDITADYYPLKKKRGEYMVKTQIKEKGSLLLELNINVVSKEQAIAICDSWEKKSDAVYGKLMEMLLLDE